MSTEEGSDLLNTTNQETQVSLETSIESIDVKCSKCHSSDINKLYITGHDVLHCICNICQNEWVE